MLEALIELLKACCKIDVFIYVSKIIDHKQHEKDMLICKQNLITH